MANHNKSQSFHWYFFFADKFNPERTNVHKNPVKWNVKATKKKTGKLTRASLRFAEFTILQKACKVWSMENDNNTRIIIVKMLTMVIATRITIQWKWLLLLWWFHYSTGKNVLAGYCVRASHCSVCLMVWSIFVYAEMHAIRHFSDCLWWSYV